jgi:hypothetical protein
MQRKKTKWRPRLETLEARQLLSVYGDFNGDGYADLAIGVPAEDVGLVQDCGAVNVIYGSATGLTATNSDFFTQASFGKVCETSDWFGASLAAGDFNGDGYADLAVGAPYEDVGALVDVGEVYVISGSAFGLSSGKVFSQDTYRVRDIGESGDTFGAALAAGDFDGDTRDDLAIGVPGEDIFATVDAGAVQILYGSALGISTPGNQFFSQDTPAVIDFAEANDHFGEVLAAEDFTADGKKDLAIGVPDEDVGSIMDAGAVNVFYGGPGQLGTNNNQFYHQDSDFVEGVAEEGDHFGAALAVGIFNADSRFDLAIGAPQEDFGAVDAGVVHVIYGWHAVGLHPLGSELWTQENAGFGGGSEAGDNFGASLAAGNVDYDILSDLVIGAPNEDLNSIVDAGALWVLRGTGDGLESNGTFLTQADFGSSAEDYDGFGTDLAIGDFDGVGNMDLAASTPYEDWGAIIDAGTVHVLYASGQVQYWHQDMIGGTTEAFDFFGRAVASGNKSSGGDSRIEAFNNSSPKADERSSKPDSADRPKRVHDTASTKIESVANVADPFESAPISQRIRASANIGGGDLAAFGLDPNLNNPALSLPLHA